MNSLIGVLCRFRQEDIAIMADQEAMFHQVYVHSKDLKALRFLWFSHGDLSAQPHEYQMIVHLFGGIWSPSCSSSGRARAKRSGNHIDFASFKTQRKKVKHVIKKAHDDYVDSYILNDFGKKPKKFWKYIKAKRYSNTKIKCLTKNGQTFTETKEILNTMNTTFYEAFGRTNTPSSITDLSGQVNASFPDMPKIDISSSGIQALIDGLDSSKAPGPDNISPKLLKLIPEEASRCLKLIFETSLRKSEVPQDWKKAIVTPVYKKGAKSDPKNYRPVSLTSIPCKLLEHIIKSAMYAHLENHHIITDRQHGFRKKYSCTSQLLTLIHSLAESINSKGQTDIIFLDFSKAFDKVCHKKLLSKLQACGIHGENLSWIEGFLFGR